MLLKPKHWDRTIFPLVYQKLSDASDKFPNTYRLFKFYRLGVL